MNENTPRLRSLDALRGFDMFWIVGGRDLLVGLTAITGWGVLRTAEAQARHVEWNGFTLWDGIFPLFLFLAGVSMPLSFAKRLEQGRSRTQLAGHALRRGLVLVLLGLVYNGLLGERTEPLRCASVLGRIGLAWMFAAWISLFLRTRGQVLVAAGILLGYWALLVLVPVPGQAAPSLEPGKTFTDWFDRNWLPGRLYRGDRDPEGLLGTLPAIVTALAGSWAGMQLVRRDRTPAARSGGLALAGALALGLGWLWHPWFPVNKNLWSSSFVLVTAGGSALLLALFHWLIDVRGWHAWSFPFVVIGTNAITIYMLGSFIDFDGIGALLLGGPVAWRFHPSLLPLVTLALEWVLLYALWRKRLFLRV